MKRMLLKQWLFTFAILIPLGIVKSAAQTGPAGISTGIHLWLKADAGITDPGSGLTSWLDQSGGVITNTINGNPTRVEGVFNFNPVTRFDGTGDFIKTNLSINHSTAPNVTIYAVYRPSVDNAGAVWGEDDAGWDRFMMDDGGHSTYNSIVGNGSNPTVNYNIPNIFTANTGVNTTVIYQQAVANGTFVYANGTEVANFTSNQSGNSNTFEVGTIGRGEFHFNGDVAEIIVYSNAHTATERNQVESYLAIKYGLTKSGDYVNSDGTTIWTADGTYNQSIITVGRDDASSLGQIKSKSPSGILTVLAEGESTDNSNTATNYNFTDLADKEFLFLASNGAAAPAIRGIATNAGGYTVSKQEWKVEETADTGAMTLTFEEASIVDGQEYHLFTSTDAGMSNSANVSILATATASGNIVEFTGVDLTNGYITFGKSTIVQGPGNVDAGIALWLKSDAGITDPGSGLTSWLDESGAGITNTISGNPTKVDGLFNFNPTTRFDGTGDFLETNLSINHAVAPNVTIYTVYTPLIDNSGGVWGEEDGGWDRFMLDLPQVYFSSVVANGAYPIAANRDIPNIFTTNTRVLTTVSYQQGVTDGTFVYANGTQEANFTSTQSGNSGLFQVGRGANHGRLFNGDIAEILVYNKIHSAAERQKVESYLAIKYGLTKSGDYVNSDGVTIWTVDGTYNQSIITIGRDDVSSLGQIKSKSTTGILTVLAEGESTDNSNTSANYNFTDIADKEFLFFASNGGALTIDRGIATATSGYNVYQREWKVQETADTGALTLTFEDASIVDGQEYHLFTSVDAGMGNSANVSILGTATASGNVLEFTGVNLTNGYVTIGKPDMVQGPGVHANVALWLKADGEVYNTGTTQATEGQDITTWSDASGNSTTVSKTGGNQPSFSLTNHMNFNPVVSFDRSNTERFTTTNLGLEATSNATVFLVSRRGASGTYYSIFGPTDTSAGVDIELGYTTGGNFIVHDGGAAHIGTSTVSYAGGLANMFSVKREGDSWGILSNGGDLQTGTRPNGFSNSIYQIGASNNANYFNGDIAELLVYNAALSSVDINKIESYLAIKYGITKTGDYVNSDGTIIWTADGVYNKSIVSVGRDDTSSLGQIKSKATTGILTVLAEGESTDNSNTTANYNFTDIADKEFLFLASNGETVSAKRGIATSTGGYSVSRREWKVQETVDTGAMTLTFEDASIVDGQEYHLFTSVDAGMGNSTNISILATATASGNIVEFTGVDLTNGYITLGKSTIVQGPGNIDAGIALWLKSDTGLTDPGSGITAWTDESGAGVTNTINGNPTKVDDTFNFNPITRFDGTGDFIKTNLSINHSTAPNVTIYAVYTPSVDNAGAVWGEDDAGWDRLMMDNGSLVQFNSVIGNGASPIASVNYNIPNIFTANTGVNTTVIYQQAVTDGTFVYANGTEVANFTSNQTGSSNAFEVGAIGRGDFLFNGDVAEVIVYNNAHTAIERNQVESYLAIKYGLTKLGDYVNSDGTTIWTADGAYNQSIFTIGRDDASSLGQIKSKSPSGILTVLAEGESTDNSNTAANYNFTDIADKEFLFFASNGGALTVDRGITTATSGYNVYQREWKVEETADTGAMTLTFEDASIVDGQEYHLFTSSDAGMGNSANVSILATATASGNIVEFTGVDLTNGYITLGKSDMFQGPANVDASIALWLKSDAGVIDPGSGITAWTDESGAGMTNTINGNPTKVEGTFNFNPVTRFDGTGDFIKTNLSINHSTAPNITIYAVYRPSVDNAGAVWGEDDAGWDRLLMDDGGHSTYNSIVANGSNPTANYNIPNIFTASTGVNTTVIYQQAVADGTFVYANGTEVANFTSNQSGSSNTFEIGAIGRGDFLFNGDVAEIVVYNKVHSAVDRGKVESYLAIKYGLTKSGDYVNSDGTTIWAADAAYNHEIIGIGRDDNSQLDQKQSKTANANTTIAIGTIAADNASNANTFTTDKGYVLLGHNNASTTLEVNADMDTNLFGSRTAREWKLIPTNIGQDVLLKFNGFDNTFNVFIDADGDFTSGASLVGILSATGEITIPAAQLASVKYITIGKPKAIYYVNDDATGANNGTSWADAFTNLEDALVAVGAGDEIRVAHGTYKPSASRGCTDCSGESDYHFLIDKSISIKGSYNPTTDMQDFSMGRTILDGDVGVQGDHTDNTHHILVVVGEVTSTIDGVQIQNAKEESSSKNTTFGSLINYGGNGVYLYQGNLTISHSIIKNNTYSSLGAIFIFHNLSTSLVIKNSLFIGNIEKSGTNKLIRNRAELTLVNNTFINNSTSLLIENVFNSSITNLYNNVIYNSGTPVDNSAGGTLTSSNNFSQIAFTGATVLAGNPFTNSADPDGADNIFGTTDDGLFPSSGSAIINGGTNAQNTATTDFTGAARIHNNFTIDAGAYEHISTPITFTGTTVDWNNAANWSSGTVPNMGDTVVIPAGKTVTASGNVEAGSITVDGGLTVGGNVTVTNDVEINSGASIIAQSATPFNIKYNRNLSTNNWYLVSSAVTNETLEDIIANHTFATGSGANIGIGDYVNTNPGWSYVDLTATGTLASGEGRAIKLASNGTISVNGAMPLNDISIAITDGTGSGGNAFNLVGNPFPSYIGGNHAAPTAINNLLRANTAILAEETIWFWDQATDGYVQVNQASALIDGVRNIAPGQGFFVKSNASGGNFSFTEALQSHGSGDTFMKSSQTNSVSRIKLSIANKNACKKTDILYLSDATTGWDNGYDSTTFDGADTSFNIFTELLTDNQGKSLGIQSLPNKDYEKMVIPVGVHASAGSKIRLTAEVTNLPNGIRAYIEDKEKGSFILLNENNASYEVTLTKDISGTGRFFIHTTPKVLGTDDLTTQSIKVYLSNTRNLRITGIAQGETTVDIYSVIGQKVLTHKFIATGAKDVTLPQLSAGVYLVKVKAVQGELTKKIIIE